MFTVMKKIALLLVLLLALCQLFAQRVPVTFYYDARNSQYQTVTMLSNESFNDADNDRIFKINMDLPIGQYDYMFWVDNAISLDPWNNEKKYGYDGSTINIADPMVTYLLPVDGDIMRENQIRADFAFTASNPPLSGSIYVTINGNAIANAKNYYNAAKRTLIINQPPYLQDGENTVVVGFRTNKGSIEKTSTFSYHSAVLMMDSRTFRMKNIFGWGRVLEQPYPTTVYLKCKENIYPANVNDEGYFGATIEIESGENTVSVALTQAGLNQPVDQKIIKAYLRHDWWVELNGTVTGTTVTIEAVNHDIDRSDLTYSWVEGDNNPQSLGISGSSDFTFFTIPEAKGEYQIELHVTANDGTVYIARKIFLNTDHPHFLGLHERAPWMDKAILYETETSYFDYGTYTYQKMKKALPHMKELGIDAVYLPPYVLGGYVALDHFELFSIYGTKEELIDLINTAHEYGLKIFFDISVNGLMSHHPFIRSSFLVRNPESPYYNFNLWAGEPFVSDILPALYEREAIKCNFENPYVVEYFVKNYEYWLEEFDIDGFRFDSGQMVLQRSTIFASYLLKRLKNIKPDCWILNEGDPRDETFNFYEFGDAAYNWSLNTDWGGGYIGFPGIFKGVYSIDQLDGLINEGIQGAIADSGLIMNYANVDYHDYFHNRYGWEQERTALAIVLTTYGIPCIFQGEEVGAEWANGTFDFSDPLNTMPFYKRLIGMRKTLLGNYPVVHRVSLSSSTEIYAYTSANDTTMTLTVCNFTGSPKTATIDFSDAAFLGKEVKFWTEITNQEEKTIDTGNTTTVNLEPWKSKIFALNIPLEQVYPQLESIELVSKNGILVLPKMQNLWSLKLSKPLQIASKILSGN